MCTKVSSNVVGKYAGRPLKTGCAAQPKGCSASFVLFLRHSQPWAELRSLLITVGRRICQRWCRYTYSTHFDYQTYGHNRKPVGAYNTKLRARKYIVMYLRARNFISQSLPPPLAWTKVWDVDPKFTHKPQLNSYHLGLHSAQSHLG